MTPRLVRAAVFALAFVGLAAAGDPLRGYPADAGHGVSQKARPKAKPKARPPAPPRRAEVAELSMEGEARRALRGLKVTPDRAAALAPIPAETAGRPRPRRPAKVGDRVRQ